MIWSKSCVLIRPTGGEPGNEFPPKHILSRYPRLAGDSEGAFELIYGEYLVRELLGECPKLDEFVWRFPRFADRLRRQLDLHQVLADQDESDKPVSPPPQPAPAGEETSAGLPELPGYQLLEELGRGG